MFNVDGITDYVSLRHVLMRFEICPSSDLRCVTEAKSLLCVSPNYPQEALTVEPPSIR